MSDGPSQPIARARGRPMLQWVGKRPLREVRSFPAQLVERFGPEGGAGLASPHVDWSGWPERYDRGGLLFHGDVDAAYDGQVFNVALADIPERRQELVAGAYTVSRPAGSAHPVAVRITDMLGEEVLVIEPEAAG